MTAGGEGQHSPFDATAPNSVTTYGSEWWDSRLRRYRGTPTGLACTPVDDCGFSLERSSNAPRCNCLLECSQCNDRSKRPLQWTDLAEGRLCLDRLWRNGAFQLSSPGCCASIPRAARKFCGCHPPLTLRSQAMRRRSPPASPIAIKAAMVRARKQ